MSLQKRPSTRKANIATSSDGIRYALAVISRRAVSSMELKKKLKGRGASDEIIEASLARIRELGYLNDREYARRRALLMAERGYGDYAIRLFLEGLGFSEEMACDALGGIPEDMGEGKRIAMIIARRKDLGREKLTRFLAGRGFPLDLVIDTVGGVDE